MSSLCLWHHVGGWARGPVCQPSQNGDRTSGRTRGPHMVRAKRFLLSQVLHVIGVRLSSQSASEKHNQEKSPQTFAHLVNFSKNVSAIFYNRTILLFRLENKQTFHVFSLRDLRFVFCSRDLDILRAQRIIGSYLITHKSTRSRNPITWFRSAYLWHPGSSELERARPMWCAFRWLRYQNSFSFLIHFRLLSLEV